jgi:hypothetical protein
LKNEKHNIFSATALCGNFHKPKTSQKTPFLSANQLKKLERFDKKSAEKKIQSNNH